MRIFLNSDGWWSIPVLTWSQHTYLPEKRFKIWDQWLTVLWSWWWQNSVLLPTQQPWINYYSLVWCWLGCPYSTPLGLHPTAAQSSATLVALRWQCYRPPGWSRHSAPLQMNLHLPLPQKHILFFVAFVTLIHLGRCWSKTWEIKAKE